jgi:hypothetical protein
MSAADVLEKVTGMGVAIHVSGRDLILEPASKLPANLAAAIRQNKAGLLALVTLLGRLQAGQRWLTEQYGRWLDGGSDAASDEEFSKALGGWDALEKGLRGLGYLGCVCGPGQHCPEDAPVRCDSCVGPRSYPSVSSCLICGQSVPRRPGMVYLVNGVRHENCRFQSQPELSGMPPPPGGSTKQEVRRFKLGRIKS